MGIHHFFYWLRKTYPQHLTPITQGTILNKGITTLLLDMNGIFHNAAQKVYQYGDYKPTRLFSNTNPKVESAGAKERRVFKQVCFTIESLVKISNPTERLILCIDGPAPLAKQCQQRSRRYKSVKGMTENDTMEFNPNCITPGTVFLDRLSSYIDWFIRKKMTEDSVWGNLDIIFSNEKHAGEGEHKAVEYVRKFARKDEIFCINGMDADLIMLTMATHHDNFYILRDNTYDTGIAYHLIDIYTLKIDIINCIEWSSTLHEFNRKNAVNDFVYFMFLCGNDFLPHIPSIEIIEAGIEKIIEVYKEVCTEYGHLTTNVNGSNRICLQTLCKFFEKIGEYEKELFEAKLNNTRSTFFPDEYLNSSSVNDKDEGWIVDIEKYRNGYKQKYFSTTDDTIETICHKYIEGTQWVLTYYTQGVPCWKWLYPYHYAPPASLLAQFTLSYQFVKYCKSFPSKPYQQLLCVLPPKSSELLPQPMRRLLTDKNSEIKQFCPDDFEIDYSGKRKEYQGIPILPLVDFNKIITVHDKVEPTLENKDKRRNMLNYPCRYRKTLLPYLFSSFYGDIQQCRVQPSRFDL